MGKRFIFGIFATIICLCISVSVNATEIDVSNNDASWLVYEEPDFGTETSCDHVFSDGEIIDIGTTIKEGEIKYTCEKCGHEHIFRYYSDGKEVAISGFYTNTLSYCDLISIPRTIDGVTVVNLGKDIETNRSFFPVFFR